MVYTVQGFDDKEKEIRHPKELVLGESLRRSAERFPDRLAVAYRDRRYTYKEFNSRINRLANALIDLGIEKGDKVAVFGHNTDTWVEAAYAGSKAGSVIIPVNFRLVGPEVEYIVNHNDAVALFIDHALLDVIKDMNLRGTTRLTANFGGSN